MRIKMCPVWVDPEDRPLVNARSFSWDGRYFETRSRKDKREYLHRVIMSSMLGRHLRRNEVVDHINRQSWDNRRSNLRVVTPYQNSINRGPRRDNPCGFRGVCLQKNRWVAYANVGRRRYYGGRFDTPEEANEAAKRLRLKLGIPNPCDVSRNVLGIAQPT